MVTRWPYPPPSGTTAPVTSPGNSRRGSIPYPTIPRSRSSAARAIGSTRRSHSGIGTGCSWTGTVPGSRPSPRETAPARHWSCRAEATSRCGISSCAGRIRRRARPERRTTPTSKRSTRSRSAAPPRCCSTTCKRPTCTAISSTSVRAPTRQPSRDVTIANSRFERSGRQGISVTDGRTSPSSPTRSAGSRGRCSTSSPMHVADDTIHPHHRERHRRRGQLLARRQRVRPPTSATFRSPGTA